MGGGASVPDPLPATEEEALTKGYTAEQIAEFKKSLLSAEKEIGDFNWNTDGMNEIMDKAIVASKIDAKYKEKLLSKTHVLAHHMSTGDPTSETVEAQLKIYAGEAGMVEAETTVFITNMHLQIGEQIKVWEKGETEAEADMALFEWSEGVLQKIITRASDSSDLSDNQLEQMLKYAGTIAGQMDSAETADKAMRAAAAAVGLGDKTDLFCKEMHGNIGEKVNTWEELEDADDAMNDIQDFKWEIKTINECLLRAIEKGKFTEEQEKILNTCGEKLLPAMTSKEAAETAIRSIATEAGLSADDSDRFSDECHLEFGGKVLDWEEEQQEEAGTEAKAAE